MSVSQQSVGMSRWQTPAVVIVAGCLIAMTGFGARSIFGLFLEPMTVDQGWSRETFALALAIQNLLWGLGVPIAGALSDRFGPPRVLALGAVVYAVGIWGMAHAQTGMMLHLTAGILVGKVQVSSAVCVPFDEIECYRYHPAGGRSNRAFQLSTPAADRSGLPTGVVKMDELTALHESNQLFLR